MNDNPTTGVTIKPQLQEKGRKKEKKEERRERRKGGKKEEKFYLLTVYSKRSLQRLSGKAVGGLVGLG